jgi:hypothetical protein
MKLRTENLLAMGTGFALCGVLFYAMYIYSDLIESVRVTVNHENVYTEHLNNYHTQEPL